MLAFHNDPAVKAKYLARVKAHRAADDLRHGVYWERGKGCAVGCTIHGSDHAAYERELGIPRILARLEDGIFERLSSPHDQAWPQEFLEAIPVGADLSLVWPRFALALLADEEYGMLQYIEHARHAQQKEAIERIIALYQAWAKTGTKPAAAACADAAAACAAAACAAADAAAADAVYAADAAYAAAYAASAADAAGQRQHILWQNQTLLALLREA